MMRFKRTVITVDKSRLTHGTIYHGLFDRPLSEARRLVVDLVPEGSTVLDIASGTGELCFELAARRHCRVVGLDLSRRMIEFAQKRNRNDCVRFVRGDATELAGFEPGTFDFATILFLLHEMPGEEQIAVLNEASRVARKVVVVDSQVPLPRNLHGIVLRLVEAAGGPEHCRFFADYLAARGIAGILAASDVTASVVQHSIFWHGCREMVILDGQSTAFA